nr:hypothetical protein [uncultured Lichenicoccus sp.]
MRTWLLLVLALGFAAGRVPACAETRRVLHVSLYPYIPEPEAAALALKQGFERLHPDVIVDITFNANYYDPSPAAKGVLFEDADIHEVDVVFMRDFLALHRLQPPQIAGLDPQEPLARQAATYDGVVWGVPQWMCTDFLIYRSDQTALAGNHTLAGLARALGAEHGLLLDMSGEGQLGELYLSTLLAGSDTAPSALLANGAPEPDAAVVARFRQILALEPAGLGRNAAYGDIESFYARQFARRTGSAFVGYSEMTHELLDETAKSCRQQDRCVTADQVRVAGFPFADGKLRPTVWVDMFAIDAKVHGRTLTDARDFIRYAVSLPGYRRLLIPRPGDTPRYLLPATRTAFDDAMLQHAAPLTPQFRAIMEQGAVVAAPHLNATLHAAASRLDTALPKVH